MLDAFKIKPFDLEPIFASWTDGPRFTGNSKKDPAVDDWLEAIKSGCIERKVPEEYWHKVAQHFMGDKAKARLEELKNVMAKVHGGKYRWSWKKFKIAMRNMGWDIDTSATETLRVHAKPSGIWWVTRKKEEQSIDPPATISQRPVPTKSRTIDSSSFWLARRKKEEGKEEEEEEEEIPQRPLPPPKTKSDSSVLVPAIKPPTPTRSNSADTVTNVTHAPVWLLNACHALEFLNTEHPKVMTTLSAILITVGSIPALPAVSAGAGGAILASGAAHAVGAIAVGVGSWLQASQNMQAKASEAQQ